MLTLILTHRDVLDRTDESAFTRTFTPAAMSLGFASVAPADGDAPGVLPDMPAQTLQLLTRISGSRWDIEPGAMSRQVYPAGCDADGLTGYRAAPRVVDGGG